MIGDIENLAQLGGTVVVVITFIWYLTQRDKTNNKLYEEFNKTINNHLESSIRAIEKSSEGYNKMTTTLQELCVFIKAIKGLKGEKGERGVHG